MTEQEWPISPYCESIKHNTLRQARVANPKKCTCARALELLQEWKNAYRKPGSHGDTPGRQRERLALRLSILSSVNEIRNIPDLSRGACATPEGRATADRGFSTELGYRGFHDREAAKQQCDTCPVLRECAAWALSSEKPAGSWGGVYGGLDPWERQGRPIAIDPATKRVGLASDIASAASA